MFTFNFDDLKKRKIIEKKHLSDLMNKKSNDDLVDLYQGTLTA